MKVTSADAKIVVHYISKLPHMKFVLPLLMFSALTRAQILENYETTAENSFGKINPEAPEEIADYAQLIGVCDCLSTRRNADRTSGESQKMKEF